MNDNDIKALEKHLELKGKLRVNAAAEVNDLADLSLYYSPGVGAVSRLLHEKPELTRDYTGTNNSVAIISDGSAVLGLGDIGPLAALPVMEGKAMLFKRFAGIDGYPVVLDCHTADEIVAAVKAIAPSYGAINLEDIAAPICFEVEERLKNELTIPLMHDDQHGTAIVILAGIINSLKIIGKDKNDLKIVIVGAGAAGVATAKLLSLHAPSAQIVMVDSKGIISQSRPDLNSSKQQLLEFTNQQNVSGNLEDALDKADFFIGVSGAGALDPALIKTMNKDAVIFALANPTPEVMPENAYKNGARIVATGRSDFPNQVNNALAFPGIFRGALDNQVNHITDEHKLAAAQAIADLVVEPSETNIIPNVFEEKLVPAIAQLIV